MSTASTKTSNDPKGSGTKQLFDNPILEKLSRTHIAVPITILNGAALFILYWGFAERDMQILTLLGLFFAGFLIFTLVEYLVHKYVFHMVPSSKFKESLQYKVHGVHHDYPKDKDRLAMPPLLSATLAAVLFFFFRLIMGDLAFGFMPGFVFGYTSYLFVHYIVHAWSPPNNIFKELWIHHSIHHYKDHERAYGVSSPLWDLILGTMPKKRKSKSSEGTEVSH